METFDIFIGGPMGNTNPDGCGLTFNSHMERLAEVLGEIIDEINDDLSTLQQRASLLNPLSQSLGEITDRVLGMIEQSELGIFVISSSSPSAMYELTLMHCLGKPVIPIAFSEEKTRSLHLNGITEARSLPFYLRGTYSILLNDFGTSELKEKLAPIVRIAAGLDNASFDAESNPVTKFYGLPLLDISATTGLAVGYFVNFLQYQIKYRKSVFSMRDDLKKFVVLVPQTLDEVGGMLDVLSKRAEAAGHKVERIREKDGRVAVAADEQIRGEVILDSIGPYVVDVPAPLKVQKSSPRFVKLLDEEAKARTPEKLNEVRVRKKRLEKAMIDKFFGTLRRMSKGADYATSRLEFLTIDELMERL